MLQTLTTKTIRFRIVIILIFRDRLQKRFLLLLFITGQWITTILRSKAFCRTLGSSTSRVSSPPLLVRLRSCWCLSSGDLQCSQEMHLPFGRSDEGRLTCFLPKSNWHISRYFWFNSICRSLLSFSPLLWRCFLLFFIFEFHFAYWFTYFTKPSSIPFSILSWYLF